MKNKVINKIATQKVNSICNKQFGDIRVPESLLEYVVSIDNTVEEEKAKNIAFRQNYPHDIAKIIDNLSGATSYFIQNSKFLLEDNGNLKISLGGNDKIIFERLPDDDYETVEKHLTSFANTVNVFERSQFDQDKFKIDGVTAIYIGLDDGKFINGHTYKYSDIIENWEDISIGTLLISCYINENNEVELNRDPSIVMTTLLNTTNLVALRYGDSDYLVVSRVEKNENGSKVKIVFSNSYLSKGDSYNKKLNGIVVEAVYETNDLSKWYSVELNEDYHEKILNVDDIDRAEGIAAAAITMAQEALDKSETATTAANDATEKAEEISSALEKIQIVDPSEIENMLN